jgi:imidazolonepropionase-like amidohydrolase
VEIDMRSAGLLRLVSVLCVLLVAPAVPAADAVTVIVGATVISPQRDEAHAAAADQAIVISGSRIKALGATRKIRIPRGATVIDAHGKWVIPGLIDSHVHFFQSGNLYTRPDGADFNRYRPYAEENARNKARLPATFKVWLASGVTGVVDVGGPFWNFDVRDLAEHTTAAPHVRVAGPLISMVDRPQLDLGDPPIIRVDNPDEARKLVARELERKPDYIKVWFIHRPDDDLQAQTAIVRATADAAHAAKVPLAVHATELVTAKAALQAGADYLVHSVFDEPVDDEFIALIKQRHALYCPTLFVPAGYGYAFSNTWTATPEEERLADPQILASMHDLDRIPKEMIPERVSKLMEAHVPPAEPTVALANLKRLWSEGVTVVMGTDAGNVGTLHGPSIFREMALMRKAGLTPLEVLRSATTNGAQALRLADEVGSIAPGKLADLVILDADPLADVGNLSHAYRVIKDGAVFDPRELIDSIR